MEFGHMEVLCCQYAVCVVLVLVAPMSSCSCPDRLCFREHFTVYINTSNIIR